MKNMNIIKLWYDYVLKILKLQLKDTIYTSYIKCLIVKMWYIIQKRRTLKNSFV